MIRNSMSGTGDPASNPAPANIARWSAAEISCRAISAIGSASVEPYTADTRAPGITCCRRSRRPGKTGAPPVSTRRMPLKALLTSGASRSRSKNAGDATQRETPCVMICRRTGAALIAPGRCRSAAGMTLVTPDARFASEKIGSVDKSISPGATRWHAAVMRAERPESHGSELRLWVIRCCRW